MECKMHGAVPSSHVKELYELLKGLSGCPAAAFKNHEIVLRVHCQGAPPADIKIQRSLLEDVAEGGNRWKVRHESMAMRGKAAEQLPAAVRGVSEACCYGSDPLDFWMSLGFKMEYQSVHEGAMFAVWQGQHQLYVKLMSMKKLQGNDPGTAVPLVPEFWLVEVFVMVTADTPSQMEGLYGDACQAVNEFAAKLKDYVVLQKPSLR